MAPVRHDAAPSPPSPKKSHVPTTNGATPPAGHGLLHRLSMLILLPLLTMWDSLVFFFDRVFATILYWLGLQVRFRVDKPAPGHHPIVVATGTSTGIGFDAALALARSGYLVFAGVRKASDGDALLREWNSQRTRLESRSQNGIFRFLDYLLDNSYVPGGDIKYLLIDVAKTDTIKIAVAEVEKEITRSSGVGRPRGVYGVFANAGINAGCAFELETLAEERSTLEVNFLGALETARAFLPLVRRNGTARIVFTGSLAGIGTSPMAAASPSWLTDTASKHALYAAADSIRMELAPLGIAVSTMEPGEIATEIWVKQRGLVEKMTGHPLRSLYEPHIRTFAASMRAVAAYPGVPPAYCSVSLLHALRSPFPMPRYPVGFDSWIGRFVRWFTPDRIYDAVVVQGLKAGAFLPEEIVADM